MWWIKNHANVSVRFDIAKMRPDGIKISVNVLLH